MQYQRNKYIDISKPVANFLFRKHINANFLTTFKEAARQTEPALAMQHPTAS